MQTLIISIQDQTLIFFDQEKKLAAYPISTAKNGAGEAYGSEKTPRGWHVIRAKIGETCPTNAVFIKRRWTGEIFTQALAALHPNRDWILTRILWLSGLEKGRNRLGQVDTMRRYIYIHGTPDDNPMGIPASKGCIRMHSTHLIELFDKVSVGARVFIQE